MRETPTKLDNLYKAVRASARIVLRVYSRGAQRRDREQKSFVEVKPVGPTDC